MNFDKIIDRYRNNTNSSDDNSGADKLSDDLDGKNGKSLQQVARKYYHFINNL